MPRRSSRGADRGRPGRQLQLRFFALCLLLAVLPAQPEAAAQTKEAPGVIEIAGIITDADGRGLPELQVVLEASHRTFEFKELSRVSRGQTQRTAYTDPLGRYSLRWNPNSYFNHFDLIIGMNVRVPEGDKFYTLERLPLTDRMWDERSLTVDATIADTTFLNRYRSFVRGLSSPDERDVYERMGIPAKIDRLQLATHEEVSWWYFEVGKAYRFKGGVLAEVSEFDPVLPFGEDDETEE